MRMVASSRLTARARALAVLWVWWWASVAKGQNEEVVVAGGGGGVVETESPSMVLQNQEQQGTKNVTSAAFVITDGIVGEDWVMSAVDANVSSEFGYLTLTAQRFGYLNLRLKKDAGPLVGAMYTHVCLDLAVAENPNQPAPPQTTMTMTGHSGSPVSLGVAAHTVLQGNEALAPGASPSKFSIPLPDSIDVSWFEIRFEEMSVQGSVASVRSVSFCDGGGAGYDGYSQCLWKSEGGENNNNDNNEGGRDSLLSQSSSSGSGGGGSAATTMPFVEAVYLSGFGLSPRWHDRSYVGFFDYSYILPSGESAVKALVGPNGALSFATSASFEEWRALHFQILASSDQVEACVEVGVTGESRRPASCVGGLWNQTNVWADVSAPLAEFGAPEPWNRIDLADASGRGVFFLVTNVILNSDEESSGAGKLWVLDISEVFSAAADLDGNGAGDGGSSSHALGWGIGVAAAVVCAAVLVPALICIVFPKQPGKRLTRVPLCCVALHESFQEALDDVSTAYRSRLRVPQTVKMKAADKKGWVEAQCHTPNDREGGGGGNEDTVDLDLDLLQVFKPTHRTASHASLPPNFFDTCRVSPLPSAHNNRHSLAHSGEGIHDNTTHHDRDGLALEHDLGPFTPTRSSPRAEDVDQDWPRTGHAGKPLYKVSSILEEGEGGGDLSGRAAGGLPLLSPSPLPGAAASGDPPSTFRQVDDALRETCKVLIDSSKDLRRLLEHNRPRSATRVGLSGRAAVRRVSSEQIDLGVAGDYHSLITTQIESLAKARQAVAEEWERMREAVAARGNAQGGGGGERILAQRIPAQRIPSRTDLESTNVDILRDVRVFRLIGSGGSGHVYEGTFKGHRVAVKLLHGGGDLCEDAVENLKTEAALLQGLRHPNVVNFLGCCLDPASLCVILEYAEGGSLHTMLHVEGKQPEYGTLLQLAEDVASAMDYCHSLDPPVIHRDLKPQNILLRR